MDANDLADMMISLITSEDLLTPMKEIQKGELGVAVDLSTPQIVREPIIKLVDKNWSQFLRKFNGTESYLRKRVDPELFMVKTCREFGNRRYELCYDKDWRKSKENGTSWVTTKIKEHKNCDLFEACFFVAVARSWTLWHVAFDPTSPSVTTVVSGWKLWLVCTQTELARELCRDNGRLEDLVRLLKNGGKRLKYIHWAIQKTGDSVIFPWGLAHCVLTMSDKVGAATTSMLSYVINGDETGRLEREAWINQRFADNYRRGTSYHGN